MQCMNLLVVVALVVGPVVGQDECMPPKPGEKFVHPSDCCNVDDFIPEIVKGSFRKCIEKLPQPPRHPGPSSDGASPPPPDPEVKKAFACMIECVFSESSILTADKKLDKNAVKKAFTPSNKELAAVVAEGVEKCFASHQEAQGECSSGSEELVKCLSREVFINCPSAEWSNSAECSDLKTKVTKCPQIPVMLGAHGQPPPH